jgi:hypothetical protein
MNGQTDGGRGGRTERRKKAKERRTVAPRERTGSRKEGKAAGRKEKTEGRAERKEPTTERKEGRKTRQKHGRQTDGGKQNRGCMLNEGTRSAACFTKTQVQHIRF